MSYDILLNFIPLKEQNFEFIIYRKENEGENKSQFKDVIYFNTLPIDDNNLDKRKSYWISFNQIDGFDKFVCKSNYNTKLTLHYLYCSLIGKIVDNFKKDEEYLIPNKKIGKLVCLILKKHDEGKECLLLSPYYLSSLKKFGFLINFNFLKEKNVPFNRKIQQLSLSLDKDFKSNSNFYIDKYNKIKLFKINFYSKISPLKIGNREIELEESFVKIKADTLKTKIYLVNNSNESNSQFLGIKKYGPYKSINEQLNFAFYYKTENKQFVIDLVKALKGETYPIFNGFEKFYRTKNIEVFGVKIENHDFVEFVITDIKNRKKLGNTFIPIIILSKKEECEYYKIKYRSLKEFKCPVQFVSLELLSNRDSLKWSVSNIGLQIFAKLGGTPWLVKPETKDTLIIGIGQSHELEKTNNGYKIIRYFAYSVLTDSSGSYKKLDSIGKYTSKEEYLQKLSEHVKNIVEQNKDFDSYVIHCPFKIRKFELEKIKDTIAGLDNNKKFVVIRINTQNNYFGFNLDFNSLVPYESSLVELSLNDFLIWFEGLQYHKPTINRMISGPTYIEFYYSNKDLSFNEKKSYLQDILNLSGTNWRGFNSKSTPISIHYTKLVAKFIKHFSKYGEVDINEIKPWFL